MCYLLGITDVDPLSGIYRCTFPNPLRDDFNDVDIDFEHWRQKNIMERIPKWSGKTARIQIT